MSADHVIEIDYDYDPEKERASWTCECGRGGSCDVFLVDVNAEKHVPEGESVVHRYPAR